MMMGESESPVTERHVTRETSDPTRPLPSGGESPGMSPGRFEIAHLILENG